MIKRLPPYVLISTLTLSVSIALSGCSGQTFPGSQLLGGQQHASVAPKLKPLKKITANQNAALLWQIDTGTADPLIKIHPYISDTAIYTAAGQTVSAWNKKTGQALWSKSIAEPITGGVNGDNQTIFVGTRSGKTLSLNASNGKTRWISDLETEVLAVSESQQGMVVLRTIDGKLHGLNSQTGEVKWQRQQRTPSLSMYGASVPIIVDRGVVAGFDNGKVAAYDLSQGKPLWEITLSVPKGNSELERIVDVDGRLKALGSALFTSNINGRVIGANMNDGQIGWSKVLSSSAGADAHLKGVYSTDQKGHIWKLAPRNGSPIWRQDDLENRHPTTPTLTHSGSHLIVGDRQGNLHWLETTSGKIVSRIKGDSAGYQVPVISDGDIVYAFGQGGVLSAIRSH